MGRLFWKILLAFWATLIAAGLLVGAGVVLWSGLHEDELRPAMGPRAAAEVNRAAAILAREGPEALGGWLRERRHGRRGGLSLWVIDRDGNDLLGRPLPPESLLRARGLARLGEVGADEPAVRYVAADGREFLLLMALPRDGWRGRDPLPPWLLIGAGLLASLVGSTLLARHFTRPVIHLRAAFSAAADGHLGERVQPRMGRRRDEIADLGRHFDSMAGRLQALIGAQRQLLHDVSHELRSPLARMQAAIGLARQDPARVGMALDRVEREAGRLDELVGEVLTLSRLEAGMSGTPVGPVDITELVAAIADDARFEAEAAGRGLRFEAPPGEFPVVGRAELLQRAFENVIRNAVRYTASGTVVEVTITREPGGGLLVTVADQGPGVPPADLETIFEPFQRGVGAGVVTGFGLGLAIARRAIEGHGGRVAASNRAGGGLRIEIRLPLLPTDGALVTEAAPAGTADR